MHRFWEIDEMVRLLVTNLPVTNFGKRKRFRRLRTSATAVALACCSKQLSAIVLDSLWEDVFDLNQLLKCFPPNSWEMRDGEFAFLRCPSTKEWDRFSSYARRIRTFSPCSIPTQVRRVSLEAYHLLSMQTPNLDHHLVPNLRSIHWRSDSWESIPFLRLFLNPELKNVRFDFPDDKAHPYRSAAVSLIPTRALTHLRLEFTEKEDPSLDALLDLLDGASGTLRSVSLGGGLSTAVIEKLLQLPNLRSLDVRLPETRISPPVVVFPSLEELVISYREAGSWLHILKNVPNPALQKLNVTFLGSSPTHLQTLGYSLLNANIGRTLMLLECSSKDGISITEEEIHPFLSFGKLTTLNLSSSCTEERCGVQLYDSIVSRLAMALPQLTSLMLGDIPCKTSTSDVTIKSLVALSTHCVDLDVLRLHFNANDILSRGAYANSETRKFTCKLRTLSVGSQPLPSNHDDILLVTFTILRIFPHVENITSAEGDWELVRRGVELFRKAHRIVPPSTTD